MKKNLNILIIAFSAFLINTNVVMATENGLAANCDTDSGGLDMSFDDNTGGGSGQSKNGCEGVNGCIYNNSLSTTIEVDLSHLSVNGNKTLQTMYVTNDPRKKNNPGTLYMPNLPNSSDGENLGIATQMVMDVFESNNYALAKKMLSDLGADFKGVNGTDAFGIVFQPMVQYRNADGSLHQTTLKEFAKITSNPSRLQAWLKNVTTGTNDLLNYIIGANPGMCASMPLLFASNDSMGCGMNILDITKFLCPTCKQLPKTCPGGSMSVSGSIGNCSTSKGGNTFIFTNSASGGSRSDIHRLYGKEKEGVGTYCALYCQERGEATLPGATGEALALGSYIIWPTSEKNFNNTKFQKDYYPLKFTGVLYCKLGVRPDSNLPGSNGGCFDDPVATYKSNYKTLNDNWYQLDYSGRKFEQVREEYTIRNQGMCDSNYNDHGGKTSCAKAIAKGMHIGGTRTKKIDPCEADLNRALPGEEQELTEREKKLREAETAYNNVNPKTCLQRETKYRKENGIDVFDHVEVSDPCAQEANQKRAAMESARNAYNQQKSIVNAIKNMIGEINSNKQTCKAYTKAFNDNCTILHNMRRCGLYQVSTNVYSDFNSSVNMNWQDEEPEYNTGNVEKISSDKKITKQGAIVDSILEGDSISSVHEILGYAPTTFSGDVNKIKANEYEVTAEDIYSLKTGYSYIDKDTLKYKKSKSGLTNYIDISAEDNNVKSVVPTSYNNKVGKVYNLKLDNIKFGSSMSNFGSDSTYVCKQTFTKSSDVCVCPENTKHAGKELGGVICDSKDTCLDAQSKYCDAEVFPDSNVCDAYCDPPMENISIASCINAGYTREECKQKICPYIKEPIKCKNTNGVGGEMDITSCVETKMMQGKSKEKAIDECDALICPLGKFIIYRTIKLENPFPGKEISKIAEGFNNEVIGRYPGYNWNSKTTVSSKIRNNRDTSGTTIYQTREPLYRFILNGTNIEKIRNYNKEQKEGYNDFTLECKKNKSAGCISYTFVHNSLLSGLIGGTCQNIGLDNGFYTCVNNYNKTK